jgi:hypothetical protein
MQVFVLTENEIEDLIRRTADAVTERLRTDIESARTPELMIKPELAKYLRCDLSKVNRYMKGDMPVEYFGSTPRFRKVDIDHWLKGNPKVITNLTLIKKTG